MSITIRELHRVYQDEFHKPHEGFWDADMSAVKAVVRAMFMDLSVRAFEHGWEGINIETWFDDVLASFPEGRAE